MNTDFLKSLLFAWFRHAATGWAAALATKGLITGDQTDQLISAGLFVISLGWSALDKYVLHKKDKQV